MSLEAVPDNSRARYVLGTLLSTLGMPYRFGGERHGGRCVRLLVGAAGTSVPGPATAAIPEWEGQPGRAEALAITPTLFHGERGKPPLPMEEGRGDGQDSVPITQHSALSTQHAALSAAFFLLSRQEEYTAEARDQHDRFLWAHTSVAHPRLAVAPLVSEYVHRLLARLAEASMAAGLPMIRKEFWPHGKPMAASLTHDVDVVRRGKLPRGVAVRDVRGAVAALAHGRVASAARRTATMVRTALAGEDPYWTFDRISAMEREHGYRATYFFMADAHHPEDAAYRLREPRIAKLIRRLSEEGCEIGLHGSYGSYRDAESLRHQKVHLEAVLARPVRGHRNHLLRFRAPDSWRAQEAAGFSYDATLGFADHEGFRGCHAFPFRPYDLAADRAMDLLEIPLAAMDVTFSRYRRLRAEKAWEAVRTVLEQTLAVNGLATLLWHNDTFYDPEHPGSASLYEAALAWLSETGAYVAPCEEVERWWRARDAIALPPLSNGRTGWRMESPHEIEGLVLRATLPEAQAAIRLRGEVGIAVRRDGPDHLLEFPRIPAGSTVEIEIAG